MTEPVVFISYSHKDELEKNLLLSHLGVLERANLLSLWSDDQIVGGGDWEKAIDQAINQARVAILLITANFLTSDHILGKQVPALLERHRQDSLIIFPIIARSCAWRTVDWLAKMKVIPRDGIPVWSGAPSQIDQCLATIAEAVAVIVKNALTSAQAIRPPVRAASTDPEKTVLSRPQQADNDATRPSKSGSLAPWRVLIVEDEPTWQRRLARILQEINCTVTIASSYDEAETYLANVAFDLATIDLNLDKSTQYADGLELILQIRKTLGSHFPLIIITGTGDMEEQRRAFRDYNVFDFIQKAKLDFEEFQTAVVEAITSPD